MKPIILFDGECNLCDTSVQFILKRDHGYYQFASLQGIKGQELIQKHRLPSDLDSVVVIEEGIPYVKSDAALQITKHLNGAWPLASIFRVLPRAARDLAYDFIAKHRHKWFGQKQQCLLPSKETRARFHE
ncbi:thiol-disulfide oxidoreductase DCC family protein [Exiguobacterium sp. K1]|uniref:thiol-disulfide oxidoreductase DCC family protein n=1 Tax=Exiguobacterium sp. K1 TaxID=2980105 RepID=UPI00299D4296|nr:thiol-disulfide oxidoreductase DCC family protein [Exiguobacterium sp. K1]MDX1260770.1 thiol-disulfide oxidoreductase DCC family protein [Exiguobacterium sp. K1]